MHAGADIVIAEAKDLSIRRLTDSPGRQEPGSLAGPPARASAREAVSLAAWRLHGQAGTGGQAESPLFVSTQ